MNTPNHEHNRAADPRARLAMAWHWISDRRAGFRRYVGLGAAGLAVVGLGALGSAVTGNDPQNTNPTAGLHQSRDVDPRADRSGRLPDPTTGTPNGVPTEGLTQTPSVAPTEEATTEAKPPSIAAPKAKPGPTAPKAKPGIVAPKKAPGWVTPMAGAEVTSCYGMRGGVMHAGMDYALPPGTPVRSVGPGTVTSTGWAFPGYGISVVVDHGNGYQTHYAHLSGTTVSVGQRVGTGSTLGHEGSTGDSTGPHLHFEVHNGMWNQVDPASWLRAHGANPGGC